MTARSPHPSDRLIDAVALMLVVGGIGLFAIARSALTGLANGTRTVPRGVSAVAVTDLHVAQSTMAFWVIAIGVVVGVVAAVKHQLRSRS